eukprot:TRINITY_DN23481_c0_g1_i1.p2 TRINITY_DN23481_c0_g1~~TRINITY_DN23481_c0_g1_i1.p2  ORF type:complete len:106 (-),score=9.14 TRINITY_DN23481_c0_g1_i1:129-446(-)
MEEFLVNFLASSLILGYTECFEFLSTKATTSCSFTLSFRSASRCIMISVWYCAVMSGYTFNIPTPTELNTVPVSSSKLMWSSMLNRGCADVSISLMTLSMVSLPP